MKYIIVGTAGHVDHGKTAIIKALTGVDTDRLKEEKKRGISIDLGFASLQIGDCLKAGIVDVPGHERFLKNMLAGTGAIDLAVLVIAADESVMPQTREHLAMLDLLGIKHGIIVINKIDKIDKDDLSWLELVEHETGELVKGTFLENAPLCKVSAITGQGLDHLLATIAKVSEKMPERDENAPFRLWIDRVFSAKGHGAVVTGSVLTGKVKVGDNLLLYPQGTPVRVRALESHEEKADILKAGQRAAINISGMETSEIARGMSLSHPERSEISDIWDIKIKWRQEVNSSTRVRLHIGTEEVLGRVYKYKDTEKKYMRLILEKPLAASLGDQGILRLYSPQILLGAVTLLSAGRHSRKFNPGLLLIEKSLSEYKIDLSAIITGRLSQERQLKTIKEIARLTGYFTESEIQKSVDKLVKSGIMARLEAGYLLQNQIDLIAKSANDILKEFHLANKQESGMGKEILRQRLKIDEKTFENLLTYWKKENGANLTVTGAGSQIAQKSHAKSHHSHQRDLTDKSRLFLKEAGFDNIDSVLLGSKLGLEPKESKTAWEMLLKAKKIIKVGVVYLSAKTIENVILLLQNHFKLNPILNITDFKDIIGSSRKIAVPLLEYLDAQKYTVRVGDARKPTSKLLAFSAQSLGEDEGDS